MVTKKKSQLTSTQKALLRSMIRARREQTTYKISKKSDKSWKATKDNLEKLKRKGVVSKNTKGGVSNWKIN